MNEETKLLGDSNPVSSIIDRMGMGLFQIILIVAICTVFFVAGAEVMILNFLAFKLEEEWGLNSFELAFLTTSVLAGFGIGYYLSGMLENTLGRIQTVKYSLLLMILAGFASSFMVDIWALSIMRMLVGFGSAYSSPSIYALTIEMTPTRRRSLPVILADMLFGIGLIYVILLALTGINWRVLLALTTAPLVPAYILIYLFLLESPLYLSRKMEHKQAILNINRIAEINKTEGLSIQEEESINAIQPLQAISGMDKLRRMFDEDHLSLSIKLIVLWILVICIYFDLALLLPVLFEEEGDDETTIYLKLLAIFSVQLPFDVLLVLTIEKKQFGRKNTFNIVTLLVIMLTAVYLLVENSRFATIVFIMSLANVNYITLMVYTPEVYETEIRATGIGLTQLFSRVIAGFGAYFILFMFEMNSLLPFILIGCLEVCSLGLGLSLPYDSTDMKLDTNSKDFK